MKMSDKLTTLAVIGAVGCSQPVSDAWLDTGELDANGSVLVVESSGWMAGPTRTIPASPRERLAVDGWPIAACVDANADHRCDFESEPFALCGRESTRVRCTPRPWKLTLTRTQVFDGTLGDQGIAISPRPDESTVHAAFSTYESSGIHVRKGEVSLCWRKRGLCSTQSEGDATLLPLKLCGVDEDGSAELELSVGDEQRTLIEATPGVMDVDVRRDLSSSRGLVLHVSASEDIDQALVQIRSPSEKVLWTSTERTIRLPLRSFDVAIPDNVVSTAESGSQLLIQLVAVEQDVRDSRLLTQAITETRVWIPLP